MKLFQYDKKVWENGETSHWQNVVIVLLIGMLFGGARSSK